jgi:hypothetical protein
MAPPAIVARHPRIEEVLDAFGADLAGDRAAYRGHVYRVFHFCRALAPAGPPRDDAVALAAVFHDLGIWSDRTVDYLPPSVRRLRAAVERSGRRTAEVDEIARMIEMHHKMTPCRGDADVLVEAFRRADLVDVTFGLVRFGLPRAWVREVQAAFAEAGFHARIARLVGGWALRHPARPLPMLRW